MASPNTKRDKSKSYCDLYNTPEVALDKLFAHPSVGININSRFLEPCCGKGVITEYLKKQQKIEDYNIWSMDIVDHGYDQLDSTEDFLALDVDAFCDDIFVEPEYIITNPPYKLAKEFVLKGLKVAKEQYHLLRLSFLEGKSRYEELFALGHLKGVYVFTSRITCSEGIEEIPTANSVTYCWLHFDREFVGQPTLYWI
ncbi:MAG: hypothetical protein EOM41_00845 [Bacilli bacterium]|nr:hypothetical protein [Bacilli bacterium]